jgi:hypothetical protein
VAVTWYALDILVLLGDQGLEFAKVDTRALNDIDQDVVCHLQNFVCRLSRAEECPEGSKVREGVSQRPASKRMDEMQQNTRDRGRFGGCRGR